jgi:hypothetical protein
VRVAFFLGILMMLAMGGDPEDWPAFESKRSASGQEIFHPLGSLVSSVGEQPMVAHADAQAARNPPQKNGHEQRFPSEKEKCGYGAYVERDHKESRNPVY